MHHFRDAVRALQATPLVTTVAILSLALGIGANTAIFSIVNSLVLRTLPVREPQRLVQISTPDGNSSWTKVLIAIGTLAGWLPARPAARIDPVDVLREG